MNSKLSSELKNIYFTNGKSKITELWTWSPPYLMYLGSGTFRKNFEINICYIKIYENHWEAKFSMILMKFDIRNPYFEPPFYGILWFSRFFFIILHHCWSFLDRCESWVVWKLMKTIEKLRFPWFDKIWHQEYSCTYFEFLFYGWFWTIL